MSGPAQSVLTDRDPDNYVGVGSWTKIGLNNTDYNDQGAFDAGTNLFTAPVDGTYPGLVLDRLWRVIQLNAPATKLFAPLGVSKGESLLDLVTSPMMPDLVENWPEVAHHTMLRLRAESAAAGGIPALETAILSLSKHAQILSDTSTGPTVPTVYRFGIISQFSSVNDETLDDLRLELFFSADLDTAYWLASFQ